MIRGRETRKKVVLVVDDSKTSLMMTQMILSRNTKYDVITAGDGQEALETAQSAKPDLILMDVVMPRLNGFETCKKMRERTGTRQIPIILVTTRREEAYTEAGFSSGCNDYLTKPINSLELVELLHSYLGE
jgi:CheY-like chemotaxis protein